MKNSLFTNFLRSIALIANGILLFAALKMLIAPLYSNDKDDYLVLWALIALTGLNLALIGESLYTNWRDRRK